MESLSVTRGSRPLYRIRNRKSQRIHRDDDPRSPAGLVAQRFVDLLHQRLDQPLSEGPALGIAVGPDADTVVGDRKLDGIRGFTAVEGNPDGARPAVGTGVQIGRAPV